MSDRDRRAFLAVAGCLGLNEPAQVRQAQREIVPGQKIADHLYEVRQQDGVWRLEHVESLAQWDKREIQKIVERVMSVSLVPRMRRRDIYLRILVLTRRRCPPRLPRYFLRKRGDLDVKLRVRYKFVWRMPASELFQMGRASVLPFVPLTRHTFKDMLRAIELLRKSRDEDLCSQFLCHARVKYSEIEIRRFAKMLEEQTVQILAQTAAGKKLARQSKEKGIEKGIEKGRLAGLRDAIRSLLMDRFPTLAGHPSIAGLEDYDRAQQVFSRLLKATTVREARQALR